MTTHQKLIGLITIGIFSALLLAQPSLAQDKTIIEQSLDKPVTVTVINGDTFVQRDLTEYLNLTLGMNDNPTDNSESDALTDVSVLRDYFMRPHPSVSTIQRYFDQAAHEYGVPVSLLMVIGQIENNWTQTGPTIDRGWGVMHLVQNSYCNTLGEASELVGVSEQTLRDDARQNIRGAAALIAKYAGEERGRFNKLDDWFPAIAKFSGLVSPELREMQAANYLDTLREGVKAETVWEEEIVIGAKKNEISGNYPTKSHGNPQPIMSSADYGPPLAPLSADYGPALTNSAATCNYATGRTHSIDTWVNHYIGEGTYLGTISWFQTCPCPAGTCPSSCPGTYRGCDSSGNPRGASSAHFVIKNSNGEITQMVAVANTSYHSGVAGFPLNNPRSIGVEHEATAANPGMWNSAPMLNASATMARYFQNLYGFPTTLHSSPGICGHNDMPGTTTPCPGALPWSTWMAYFNGGVTPPTNDSCSNPISLTSNTACNYTSGTVLNATASGLSKPSCDGFSGSPNMFDVWYKFTATGSSQTVTVDPSTSSGDPVVSVYSSCGGSPIGCSDGGGGVTETLSLSGLTVGNTYYVRIYDYGSAEPTGADANFQICITGTPNSGLPDLTITSGTQSVSPTSVAAGSSVTASCSEDNSGSSSAGANVVSLYLSTDAVLTPGSNGDTYLGFIQFPSLPANSNSPVNSKNIQIPSGTAPGIYYFFFWADGDQVVNEITDGNNFATRQLTVTSAAQNYTITVSASPSGGGTVSGGGTFAAGSSRTVTAAANTNYTFTNWTENGNAVSSSATYTFTLNNNRNLVANFAPTQVNYTIAVSASPSAGGTVGGGGTFAAGSSRTVSATANTNYSFTNWTENGNVVSSSASYTFTLNGNRNLVANFTSTQVNYTITVSASPSAGGTVSGGGTFAAGSSRTVTATANSNYAFTNWTENGNVVSSSASYNFTLNSNRNLVANFTANPGTFTITVSASPSAGGTVSGGGTFSAGSSRTVTAIANANYTFINWTENGSVVSSSASYNFTLNSNRNLVAIFNNIPGGNAIYDSILMAPKCGQPGSICDSGSLLNGRDSLSGGAEPNQPNTINNSCGDGVEGLFHSDESLDRIKVSTLDSANFASGKTVKIDATVWAWNDPTQDHLDLYYAADANNPNWIYIAALQPAVAGSQVLSTTYVLPTGNSLQAVRGVFRYQGAASSCGANVGFDDYDDLIIAVDAAGTSTNFARSSNGGVASASSTVNGSFPASGTNNGDRKGANWGNGGGWADGSYGALPDWLQIDFNGSKSITEIDVFTLQDNYANPVEPSQTTTFGTYGLTGYEVQYWNGSAWVTVTGGSVSGNNKVWRQFTFAAITTTRIRVLTNAVMDGGYSRITEVEAWGSAVGPQTTNLALPANGGVASASSTVTADFPASGTNNGDRKGANWGNGGGWADGSYGAFPDWLQIDFNGSKSITEIDVFTLQDNYANPVEPSQTTTFGTYGLTGYEVQYWNGSAWVTVTGGSVSGNNQIWRQFTFAAITTTKIRVLTNAVMDGGYSRITEVEAWGN